MNIRTRIDNMLCLLYILKDLGFTALIQLEYIAQREWGPNRFDRPDDWAIQFVNKAIGSKLYRDHYEKMVKQFNTSKVVDNSELSDYESQ